MSNSKPTFGGFLDDLCQSGSSFWGLIVLFSVFLITSLAVTFLSASETRAYRRAEEKYAVTAYLTSTSQYYDSSDEINKYRNDWQYEVKGSYQHYEDVTTYEPEGSRDLQVYRDTNGDFQVYEEQLAIVPIGIVCSAVSLLLLITVIIRHNILTPRKRAHRR